VIPLSPFKVAIILKELSVPYKTETIEWENLHKEPFTNITPNGRVPAIQDPNTGITLWESGAIIQYLIETYDKEGKISYSTFPERHEQTQWLLFQVSGQGPYYGQAAWFHKFHPEKVPSAQERYVKEVERVIGVLDSWLQSHEYLVGDKVTYADLSFVPYAASVPKQDFLNQYGKLFEGGKYPAYQAWVAKLVARDSVKQLGRQYSTLFEL
jgi:glutathione S-transferase